MLHPALLFVIDPAVYGDAPPAGGGTPPLEQVATPVIDPPSGSSPGAFFNVTITCETAGATIYSRVDGGGWEVYSGSPREVAQGSTVDSYAEKSGMLDSEIATTTYAAFIDAPTFSGVAQDEDVTVPDTLTITGPAGEGSLWDSIYYTISTDGNEPAEPTAGGGILYGGSLAIDYPSIANGITARFLAACFLSGVRVGEIGSHSFTVNITPNTTPSPDSGGGSYQTEGSAYYISVTSDGNIRYRTDGEPVADSSDGIAYTGDVALPVNATTRFRAKAYGNGRPDSAELDETYTVDLKLTAPSFSSAPSIQYIEIDGNMTFNGGVLTYPAAYDNVYTIVFTLNVSGNVYTWSNGPLFGGEIPLDSMLVPFTLNSGSGTPAVDDPWTLSVLITNGTSPPYDSNTADGSGTLVFN